MPIRLHDLVLAIGQIRILTAMLADRAIALETEVTLLLHRGVVEVLQRGHHLVRQEDQADL